MSPEQAVALLAQAIYSIISIVAVLVVPGMLVGLVVSIFQAATQIQEQTLSFLPRLIVTLLMLVFAGNWLLRQLVALFQQLMTAAA